MPPQNTVFALGSLIGLLLCLASGSAIAGEVASSLLPGPYSVSTWDVTVVDTSRPTAAHGKTPETPERVLKTTVWYPSEPRSFERIRPGVTPVADGGPFPLILYSHGFSSFRSEGRYLARRMASRGYIVMAADFPLTGFSTDGGPNIADVVNQPGDLSFLLDEATAWGADSQHHFAHRIDTNRVAIVGLSLGGLTTTLATFHPRLRDPRFKVAVSMAGPAYLFTETFYQHSDTPYMLIAATADALIDYPSNAAPLPTLHPEATLVSLEAGSHLGFTADARPLILWRHHPDALACWIVERRLPDEPMDISSALGGAETGINPDNPNHFCELDPLPKAMRPGRQLRLSEDVIRSFLTIHLTHDADAIARHTEHLYRALPESQTDIDVYPLLPEPTTPRTAAKP